MLICDLSWITNHHRGAELFEKSDFWLTSILAFYWDLANVDIYICKAELFSSWFVCGLESQSVAFPSHQFQIHCDLSSKVVTLFSSSPFLSLFFALIVLMACFFIYTLLLHCEIQIIVPFVHFFSNIDVDLSDLNILKILYGKWRKEFLPLI